MKGSLNIITGCMFSGKTEELIRILRREKIAQRNVLLFKPDIDRRYSTDQVVSHNRLALDAVSIDARHPENILLAIPEYTDIVGIDEVQFFSGGIVHVCESLINQGIKVFCAGLKQDFKGDVFGSMGHLLVIADSIVMLTAICDVCFEEATNTQRLINGQPAPYSSDQVLVGGTEAYQARCNNHHEVPGKP